MGKGVELLAGQVAVLVKYQQGMEAPPVEQQGRKTADGHHILLGIGIIRDHDEIPGKFRGGGIYGDPWFLLSQEHEQESSTGKKYYGAYGSRLQYPGPV